jgi:hypothetical protein
MSRGADSPIPISSAHVGPPGNVSDSHVMRSARSKTEPRGLRHGHLPNSEQQSDDGDDFVERLAPGAYERVHVVPKVWVLQRSLR